MPDRNDSASGPDPRTTDLAVVASLRERLARTEKMVEVLRGQLRASAIAREITKVMSSSLEYQRVLRTVLSGVHEALDFDRVIFFKVNSDRTALKPELSVGEAPEHLRSVRIELDARSTIVRSLNDNHPMLATGIEEFDGLDQQLLTSLGSNTFIAVPLYCPRYGDDTSGTSDLSFGHLQGLIWVDNATTHRPITADHLETITAFAFQAAIAIENSLTYAALDEQRSTLADRSGELARDKEFIERVVNNMQDGLLTVDGQGAITYFSRVMEQMTGYRREEVLGRPATWLDPDLPATAELNDEWEIAEIGEEGVLPVRAPDPDSAPFEAIPAGATVRTVEVAPGGEASESACSPTLPAIPVLKRRKLLHDADGEVIGGVILYHDITKRKEIDQLKADFTSMIIHDLRTPIGAISGFLDLLRSDEDPVTDTDKLDFYEIMQDACSKMLELVNDMLDISKIEAGYLEIHPERTELLEPVEAALAKVQVLAIKQGISIERDFDLDPGKGELDAFRIEQVVINLMSNAIKFTPEGGRITVSAHRRGDGLEIAIADTGCGMTAKEQEVIFERYKQAEAARTTKGTGLGLLICRQIVEAHGGSISVQSEPGTGSTFRIVIPPFSSTEAA